MTLDEYINSTDSNEYWRLSSGEHQNLLDEAIERIEKLEKEILGKIKKFEKQKKQFADQLKLLFFLIDKLIY